MCCETDQGNEDNQANGPEQNGIVKIHVGKSRRVFDVVKSRMRRVQGGFKIGARTAMSTAMSAPSDQVRADKAVCAPILAFLESALRRV